MVDRFHSNSRAPHEVGGVAPLHVMGRPCQPNLAQCLPGQEQHSVVEQSQPIYYTCIVGGGFRDIASQVVSGDVQYGVPEVDHPQQLSMCVAQNNAVQDECADSHQNLVINTQCIKQSSNNPRICTIFTCRRTLQLAARAAASMEDSWSPAILPDLV